MSRISVRRKTAFLNTLLLSPTPSTLGADTAPATLCALRANGLIPALVRELTVPTPYGPDACDADLDKKLARLL